MIVPDGRAGIGLCPSCAAFFRPGHRERKHAQTEQDEGEPRLTLLQTVREYGLECLRECGEAHTSQRAHALYYLALTEEAEPHLQGGQQLCGWSG